MSFNRLNYDNGAYAQELNQSVGPGHYKLKEPKISCKPCYPHPPSVRLQKQGVSTDKNNLLIDIDSELLGLKKRHSKDPSKKYIATDANKGLRRSDNNLQHWDNCFIPEEHTRLSNPSCNLRGTGINRWEWLCLNPQDRIEVPFDYNISNRTLVKDNHRPCIPTPINQELVLPSYKDNDNGNGNGNGNSIKCEKTSNVCSAYTGPSSTNWHKCNY